MYGHLGAMWASWRSGGLENINLSAKWFCTETKQKDVDLIGPLFIFHRSVDMDIIPVAQSIKADHNLICRYMEVVYHVIAKRKGTEGIVHWHYNNG